MYPISRRRSTSVKRKGVSQGSESKASVSQSVLTFLALGFTDGAETLSRNYKPSSKVKEFVTVSGEIFGALKREYEREFSDDSVVMFMRVNDQMKQVELTQLGPDVMLALDNSELRISNITLKQIYANMRNDMIKHVEIYGRDLQLTATASPSPY